MLNRQEACDLLLQHNVTPSLKKHALASEAVLRAMAARFNEDEELWGLTGLLHDLDFPATENNPARHGMAAAEILKDILPPQAVTAIIRHNAEMNGSCPETRFDFALRCGESVTGLIQAAALLRPTGYEGMNVKSIKKKMKDKAFAASVSRDNIRECEKAGLTLEEFLELAIKAMADMEKQQNN